MRAITILLLLLVLAFEAVNAWQIHVMQDQLAEVRSHANAQRVADTDTSAYVAQAAVLIHEAQNAMHGANEARARTLLRQAEDMTDKTGKDLGTRADHAGDWLKQEIHKLQTEVR